MNILKFEVEYNPQKAVKLGEFMSKFDLGISRIEFPQIYIATIKTKTTIDKDHIKKAKQSLKFAHRKRGDKVLSIKKLTNNK